MQIWLKTCFVFLPCNTKVVVTSHLAVLDRSASLYLAILIFFSSQLHGIKLGLHLFFFLSQKNKNNCDFIINMFLMFLF